MFYLKLPSSSYEFRYNGKIEYGNFTSGIDVIMHTISPQNPESEGIYTIKGKDNNVMHTQEYTAFTDYNLYLYDFVRLSAGGRGSIYKTKDETFKSLDPSISLTFKTGRNSDLKLYYGHRHQYLFQSGFSSLGLPTEYWFSSDSYFKPQYARSYSAAYETDILKGDYKLSFDLYYKNLYNQLEYKDNMIDLINSGFDSENAFLKGKGENYGINVMINKKTGKLKGWLSYSLGRAYRTFDNPGYTKKKYPASHERIHEFNGVSTYEFNNKWSIGTTLVVASGTTFTAPEYFYIINENLVTEYVELHANRLRTDAR